ERGWSYWHHLFTPRNLLVVAIYKDAIRRLVSDPVCAASLTFDVSMLVDRSARLCRWHVGFPGRPGVAPSADSVEQVFYNQALNVLVNYGNKSFLHFSRTLLEN